MIETAKNNQQVNTPGSHIPEDIPSFLADQQSTEALEISRGGIIAGSYQLPSVMEIHRGSNHDAALSDITTSANETGKDSPGMREGNARGTPGESDERSESPGFEEQQNILRQRLKNAIVHLESDERDSTSNDTDEGKLEDDWDSLIIDGAASGLGNARVKFNLMEEVLLLGLKDKEGYTSFWNDNISPGLRGALLVELALQKRVRLDKVKARRRSLVYRKVVCVDGNSTGDALLDEALKHIKENSGQYSVASWIDLLSGDTWNPINFRFHMRNLRERLAKTLADKGICGTQKQNFLIFDMTTHPICNSALKAALVNRVQSLLLTAWRSDLTRFRSRRSLALLYLAQASDVLDNALATLNYMDFDLASKHLRDLLAVDPENESHKHDQSMEVLWATVATFLK